MHTSCVTHAIRDYIKLCTLLSFVRERCVTRNDNNNSLHTLTSDIIICNIIRETDHGGSGVFV